MNIRIERDPEISVQCCYPAISNSNASICTINRETSKIFLHDITQVLSYQILKISEHEFVKLTYIKVLHSELHFNAFMRPSLSNGKR